MKRLSRVLVLVAVVFVLSMIPESTLLAAMVPPTVNDMGHVPVYALLTYVALDAARADVTVTLRRRVVVMALTVLGLLLLGGFIELIQPLTGRSESITDELRNALGIGFGLAASIWVLRMRQRRKAR